MACLILIWPPIYWYPQHFKCYVLSNLWILYVRVRILYIEYNRHSCRSFSIRLWCSNYGTMHFQSNSYCHFKPKYKCIPWFSVCTHITVVSFLTVIIRAPTSLRLSSHISQSASVPSLLGITGHLYLYIVTTIQFQSHLDKILYLLCENAFQFLLLLGLWFQPRNLGS